MRAAVEFRGQHLIVSQTRQWDLDHSQPKGPKVYQWEQALIHDPALSALEEYSDSRIGTGNQATPTEATTAVEAVGGSSSRWCHLGESV